MFGLFSNTPTYHGQQSNASGLRGGVLGFLSGLLGSGGTPAYAGNSQPHAKSGGWLPSTPSYESPKADTVPSPDTSQAPKAPPGDEGANGDDESQSDDPVPKTITIIVKPGPGTTVEQVVKYLNGHDSTLGA